LGKIHSVGIPSPNPTYSQEIRNVEHSRNIFNVKEFEDNLVTGKIKNDSGIETNDTVSTYSTYTIPFKANEPLYLYGCIQRIYYYDSNMNWVERSGATNELCSQVINKNYDGYMQFQIQNSRWASNKGEEQIEKGSVKTPYVPYNNIQIKKCNKNLWDEQWEAGMLSNTTGEPTIFNDAFRSKNFNVINSNTGIYLPREIIITDYGNTSSIIFSVLFYDENKNYIESNTCYGNWGPEHPKWQPTTPINAKYFKLYLRGAGTTYKNDLIIDYEPITEYIAHAEKTYNFPLSEGQVLMEDGTIENKVVNSRNQLILDGVTEGKKVNAVSLYSSNNLYYCVCNSIFPDGKTFTGGASIEDLVCSHFQPATGVAINHCYRTGNGPTFVFVLIDQTITTKEQANAWLAEQYANGTPVKVEYPLATPSETPFTPEQQAVIDEIIRDGTYKEVTHYTAEASINPDMELGYYKNFDSIINKIENLDSRLSLLE